MYIYYEENVCIYVYVKENYVCLTQNINNGVINLNIVGIVFNVDLNINLNGFNISLIIYI